MTTARNIRNEQHHNERGDRTVQPSKNADRLWSVQEVSRYLGIPVNTLYQWRHQGIGPKAFRVGRHLRYDPGEVRRWLNEEAA